MTIGRDDLADECLKRGPNGTAALLADGVMRINELLPTVAQAVKAWQRMTVAK